jgi:hypothetical protein
MKGAAVQFLTTLGFLKRRQLHQRGQLAPDFSMVLREHLAGPRPFQITRDLASLMGLKENPFEPVDEADRGYQEAKAMAMLLDEVVRQLPLTPRQTRRGLDGFTPDADWLERPTQTAGGWKWKLKRDLLTEAMVLSLPPGHPERTRWLLSNEAFATTNRVSSLSRAMSLVADERSLPAHRAWNTMRRGFQPALPADIELRCGRRPRLELRIGNRQGNREAFEVFRRELCINAPRSELFELRLADNNIPKRVCVGLTDADEADGIVDRSLVALGWKIIRHWITTIQGLHDARMDGSFQRTYRYPKKTVRYGIECRFQKMLVAKYENVIVWDSSRLASSVQMVEHVRDVMLPRLKAKIELGREGSVYSRRIPNVVRLLDHGMELLAEARLSYERDGVEAAERILLNHVNQRKREEFEKWWTYMSAGNDVYRENPAFQYLVLRPIVESSGARTIRPPIPLNAEALAKLYSGIEAGQILPDQNLIRLYAQMMAAGDASAVIDHGIKWLVFKGRESNSALAAHCQRSGWCIADPFMAREYLEESDFHVMFKDGSPGVALRVSGSHIVECEGRFNQDPEEEWPEILLYSAARLLAYSESERHFAPPAEIQGEYLSRAIAARNRASSFSESFVGLELQALADELKANPYLVQFADTEHAREPNSAEILATAWRRIVEEYPAAAAVAPAGLGRDEEQRRNWERKLDDLVLDEDAFVWTA